MRAGRQVRSKALVLHASISQVRILPRPRKGVQMVWQREQMLTSPSAPKKHKHKFIVIDNAIAPLGPVGYEAILYRCECGENKMVEREAWRISDWY